MKASLRRSRSQSVEMSRKPQITGAELVAETLRALRVQVVFGIVGIPVVEIAEALIACGIRFIAFRNEQSASYAAQAYGYLTGRPGVCLVVGGPGVVHAMAGIVNAQVNCWPLLVIAGYIESYQKERGGFQELDHISFLKPHTKFASQPPTVTHIPFMLEKAYRTAFYGRPGPAFIDLPANFIKASLASSTAILSSTKLSVPDCPKSMASTDMVSRVCALLRSAKSPLVVIGKGCAYARAESHIRRFINEVQLPFLPTPMGKGVMPDSHPFNVASARSTALAGADVVLLLGARLNWMLHFGTKPKWRADVIFVQVDIAAEELGNNANSSQLHLLGDIGLITAQLRDVLSDWKYDSSRSQFIETLRQNAERNVATARRLAASDRIPMSYQRALTEIKEGLIGLDVVYVSEGANTMDIGRSIFDVQEPRRRLDAGTFATMGVGMGYAIAAQLVYPNHKVVAVVGDSAFGFSAMEIETAVRSALPILIFVINNNGIYFGLDAATYNQTELLPSTALTPDTRYDLIAEACGGKGYFVTNPKELQAAVSHGIRQTCPVIVNVMIEPSGKKNLSFGWMSEGEDVKSKL